MQKKKGISLIVLVITIIVMIILAAAIILSLNNSGIISKANKAVNDTNDQEVNQIAQLAWGEAYLNGKRTEQELREAVITSLTNNGIDTSKYFITVTTKGVTVIRGWVQDRFKITKCDVTLEAGDLIQYDAGVEGYTGKWQVLGAQEGKLLILSADYVLKHFDLIGLNGGTYTSGNTTYESDYGLINGLNVIRNECNKYKNGMGAIGARCIKDEDINKLTLVDPSQLNYANNGARMQLNWNSNNEGIVDYINLENNTNGSLYYTHNNGFIYLNPNSLEYKTYSINDNNIPIINIIHYAYDITNTSKTTITLDSEKASEMIIGNDGYYLDNISIALYNSNDLRYGLMSVCDGKLTTPNLFSSYGKNYFSRINIRAVVELSPNIKIGTKDNTLGWSYTI